MGLLFGGAGEDDRAPTEERPYADDEVFCSTDAWNRIALTTTRTLFCRSAVVLARPFEKEVPFEPHATAL